MCMLMPEKRKRCGPGKLGGIRRPGDEFPLDGEAIYTENRTDSLVGEAGGFVEAEPSFWIGRILARNTRDLLEEPVHGDDMEVKMWIEA